LWFAARLLPTKTRRSRQTFDGFDDFVTQTIKTGTALAPQLPSFRATKYFSSKGLRAIASGKKASHDAEIALRIASSQNPLPSPTWACSWTKVKRFGISPFAPFFPH